MLQYILNIGAHLLIILWLNLSGKKIKGECPANLSSLPPALESNL